VGSLSQKKQWVYPFANGWLQGQFPQKKLKIAFIEILAGRKIEGEKIPLIVDLA
jgi:hypothetical protein